ncbi:MAG: response regulator transcription factor [Chloroflexi bacterium]|nr:response regulator transcription factor [Chloroflexota bacterium]
MQAIIITGNQEDREFYSFVLRHIGLSVVWMAAVKQVANSLQTTPPDLIFLASEEQSSLLQDAQTVRSLSQAPLFVLTDLLPEDLVCAVLDVGADLVLTRPLSPRIFSRYVKVLLKRAGSVPRSILSPLQSADLSLDPETRTVTLKDGSRQHLTPLEFRLLYVLMTNPEQVIPTDVIIERVWGYSAEGNRELVRGLVRRLRRKIEPDSLNVHLIHTHPGIGYRFSTQELPPSK